MLSKSNLTFKTTAIAIAGSGYLMPKMFFLSLLACITILDLAPRSAIAAPTDAVEGTDTPSSTAAPTTDADDVPDRPFPTDRPGKASSPFTVDAGHFAIESDIANGIIDRYASGPILTRNMTIADPAIKAGLTHDMDAELEIGGYEWMETKDRSTGVKTYVRGWGDETLRLKYNIVGDDGSDLAIGIIPSVKLPLASSALRNAGVTNNQIEGGIAMPMTYNLQSGFVAGYQFEIAANRNTDDGNDHASFINITSIGHPVPGVDNLFGSLEFYSDVNTSRSPDDPAIYTLDPLLSYQLTPDIAVDAETYIGLNRAAPDLQMIAGISVLF